MFSDPEQPSAELKGRATRNPLAISFFRHFQSYENRNSDFD